MLLPWPSPPLFRPGLMNPDESSRPFGNITCLWKRRDVGPDGGQCVFKFLVSRRNLKSCPQTATITDVFIFCCTGTVPAAEGIWTKHFLFKRRNADTWPAARHWPPSSSGKNHMEDAKNSKQGKQLYCCTVLQTPLVLLPFAVDLGPDWWRGSGDLLLLRKRRYEAPSSWLKGTFIFS